MFAHTSTSPRSLVCFFPFFKGQTLTRTTLYVEMSAPQYAEFIGAWKGDGKSKMFILRQTRWRGPGAGEGGCVLPYIALSFNVGGHLPPGRNVYIKLYYQGDEVCGRHGSCCCCYINVQLIMPDPCVCVFALPSNIRQTQINYLLCLRKVKCFLQKDQLLTGTVHVLCVQ